MKVIIVTQQEFDDLNVRALTFIKQEYGTSADKWCNAIIHPVNGDIAFTVEDKILPALTQTEKDKIIELSPDWFPKNEI